jgi:AcrR family transcriptional regulator
MSVTERRALMKQERRMTILAAAKELFYARGYQMTTMDSIAERTELNKATLYSYFGSKDELYVAITVDCILEIEQLLKEAIAAAESPEKKVRAIFNTFIEYCLNNPEVFRITQHFLHGAVREHLPVHLVDEINYLAYRTLSLGRDTLQEGVDQGAFRTGLDPELFCLISWRLTMGLLEMAIQGGSEKAGAFGTDRRLYEQALDMLIGGINAWPS